MIRLLHTGMLLLGLLLVSSERLFPDETENSKQLDWETWYIPIEAVSTGDLTSATPTRKPKSGFAVREGADVWDATEFVKSLDGERISGSEATYDPKRESLIVKNTKENIAAIGSAISFSGLENAPSHIVAEFVLYECTFTPKPENGFVVWPTYADLIGKNSKDVRIVDRISGTTRSGQRSKYFRRSTSGEKNIESQEASLGEEEPGIESELECVMGNDHYIDSVFSFRWRGQLQDQTKAALSFTTTFTSIASQPIVIQVSSRENAPGKYLVVTANLWQESAVDWTLESLSKMARKAREIEKERKSSPPPPEQSP